MEARLALRSGAKERAGSLLKRALAAGGGAATDWLGVGEIRLALGDTEGAAAALDSVAAYRSNLLGSPACLRLRSEVLSRQGRDLAALEVFKQYRSIKDSLEMRARWSNAKYINERHQHELALEKYRGTLMFVFAGIVLLVVVIVGIAIVLKRTKDEQILLNRTEESTVENQGDTCRDCHPQGGVGAESRRVARVAESHRRAAPASRGVHGQRPLLEGGRGQPHRRNPRLNQGGPGVAEADLLHHPAPVHRAPRGAGAHARTNQHLLSLRHRHERQGDYRHTSKKRTYNLSSEIRAKLGLNMHDTNLGKYLRELLCLCCAVVLFAVAGCSGPAPARMEGRLDRISALMRSDADSAFCLLRAIPRDSLCTRELRARFAVLMSMAYDRNYIDVPNDSLIRTAVDYYRHHGTPDDKVRTLYYLGNTYLCAYDYESAIRTFLQAEKYADRVTDLPILALLYNTSAYIYVKIKDPKAVDYYRKSADVFYQARDTNRAIRSLLYRTIVCQEIGADSIGEVTWQEIERNRRYADKEFLHQYYGIKIDRGIERNDREAVASALDEYLTRYADARKIEWGNVGDAQMFLGRFAEALSSWHRFSEQFSARRLDCEYTFYYLKTAALYDSPGCYDKALAEYRKYDRLTDSLTRNDLASDTKYLEERNMHELALKKTRNRTMLFSMLGVALVILASAMIYAYRVRRRINRRLRTEIERDKAELENMQEQLDRLRQLSDEENRQKMEIICERLETLNSFIAKSFVLGKSAGREIVSEMENLAKDRDAFVESLYETFTLTHPEFLAFLSRKGLSREETFICCLYAIGLQGKDIMAYLGRRRHYLDSSGIRAKLGLTEHDVNLGRYLRSRC